MTVKLFFQSCLLAIGIRGCINIPEYKWSLAAQHPLNGQFYLVQYNNGETGWVNSNHSGCLSFLRYKFDRQSSISSISQAAESMYLEKIRLRCPFVKKSGKEA